MTLKIQAVLPIFGEGESCGERERKISDMRSGTEIIDLVNMIDEVPDILARCESGVLIMEQTVARMERA